MGLSERRQEIQNVIDVIAGLQQSEDDRIIPFFFYSQDALEEAKIFLAEELAKEE